MNADSEKHTQSQRDESPDSKNGFQRKKTPQNYFSFILFIFCSLFNIQSDHEILLNVNHIINDKKNHTLRVQEMHWATSSS